MRVGVLALQGDFEAHAKALERAGAEPVEVRTAAELDAVCGLVIPGGESTTMLKLMEYYGLFEPLREFGRERPVFGTCAGAILIASEVLNPSQASLALVDLAIERNGYGRQLDSRVVRVQQHQLGGDPELEVVLIRAPIIRRTGGTVLATYLGAPILVDYGRHLVATFHPELSADTRVHRLFLSKLAGNGSGSQVGAGSRGGSVIRLTPRQFT
jgi:5'-phosphate synthase pdxT subunit